MEEEAWINNCMFSDILFSVSVHQKWSERAMSVTITLEMLRPPYCAWAHMLSQPIVIQNQQFFSDAVTALST